MPRGANKSKTVNCEDCGIVFDAFSRGAKCCAYCRSIRRKIGSQRTEERRRAERAERLAQKACRDCGGSMDGVRYNARRCLHCATTRRIEQQRHHVRAAEGRKAGWTQQRYDRFFQLQGGMCAICGGACTAFNVLCRDHCHSTNKPRGLLCSRCNLTLGKFRDDIELFESAVRYLKSWL